MNVFNKFEVIGIFVSIAIMALALGAVRFKSDMFAIADKVESETQSAVVAVTQDSNNNKTMDDSKTTEEKLKDAVGARGDLVDLVIDDVKLGTGKEVVAGNTVTVHYKGTLQDGTEFDSSYNRNTPFSFTVGEGRVIQGWEKGLVGMKEGGQRILIIPSEMAYGNRQVGPIPPNSVLVFAIELLEVK